MNDKLPDDLRAIAVRFATTGPVTAVQPFGSGNINDTFLVTLASGKERFILQRLNTHVFRQPDLVMKNMLAVTEHINARIRNISLPNGRRWETPVVIRSVDGQDHLIDDRGSFWRAISFIGDAETFDAVRNEAHAEEIGFALGMFHNLVSDLPPYMLADTLEGFHIAPQYLLNFDDIRRKRSVNSPDERYCVRFIEARRPLAPVLEDAKTRGHLRVRTMHGDPKVNNVLIDTSTRQAVGMIDLDTVKPGLVHYDIGDCLRSACNPLGEEVDNLESVRFEPALCSAILSGYLSKARDFLLTSDYEYLFDAIRLIAFELGLRFFTDHLEGDVYFKTRREGHNLQRALVQFKLAESIEAQETAIRSIIRDVR